MVQSSSDVQMLEQHSVPLLKLCKADENNTKLQGTICVIINGIDECIEETFCMWVIGPSRSSGLDDVYNESLFPAASD